MNKKHWIDTRLSEEEMNFLNEAISIEENKPDYSKALAGNIFKSELLVDKDNWFYETTLKKLTERMFYRDLDEYHKYHVEKEEPLPKFELRSIWVNYMKQHDFNPIHNHRGDYSFVIFVKIPTHWEEQHAFPFSAHSISPCASDFQFVWTQKDSEELIFRNFSLSLEDEGRILFFPSTLQHQVYPFYGTEEERVTISGNIDFYDPNKPEKQKKPVVKYEEKEKILETLENTVRITKEELKQMKKERENEGSN